MIMIFFNAGLICIPEVFILCKVRSLQFMNREFMINYLLMYSNKLAYLELITALVYGKVLPGKVI